MNSCTLWGSYDPRFPRSKYTSLHKCILAKKVSQTRQLSFVSYVSDPKRRSAQSGSKSERKNHQAGEMAEFQLLGARKQWECWRGWRERGGDWRAREVPWNRLERKRVQSLQLYITDLVHCTTVAFAQKHFLEGNVWTGPSWGSSAYPHSLHRITE